MIDLPSNSNKARKRSEEKGEKNIKPVVTGSVRREKPGFGQKFRDIFLAGATKSVGQYILMDVIVPAIRDMLANAGKEAIDRTLYGDRSKESSPYRRPGGVVSYNKYSVPWKDEERRERTISRQARGTHRFEEIILETRVEAITVIDHLRDLVREYGMASVAELYQLVGIASEFTDEKWGWFDLDRADVRNYRGGYLLVLPRPEPLNT